MVTTLNTTQPKRSFQENKRLVVEMVGLAGAGKTTIFKELQRRNDLILLKNIPDSRTKADIPFYVKSCLSMLPIILRYNGTVGRRINRREFAWLSILNSWPQVLEGLVKRSGKIVVIDQGAVYLLSQLHILGPDISQTFAVQTFWERIYSRWAYVLDMLVLLDAPNECLAQRINFRSDWHLIKHKPQPEIFEFLEQFRYAYDHIISILTAYPFGPKVIYFDTSQQSVDEIVDKLLLEFHLNIADRTKMPLHGNS